MGREHRKGSVIAKEKIYILYQFFFDMAPLFASIVKRTYTRVSKKYESALERSNGRSYQNFTPDRTCVLPKNTKKIS